MQSEPSSAPTMRSYPQFHVTVVGLSPSRLKQFSPADMDALCCAFQALTFKDPLEEGRSPAVLWEEWKRMASTLQGRLAGGDVKVNIKIVDAPPG